jgi:hypothetical protein
MSSAGDSAQFAEDGLDPITLVSWLGTKPLALTDITFEFQIRITKNDAWYILEYVCDAQWQ